MSNPVCCERVYSGARWDFSGHQCRRKPKVEIKGLWYCALHDPAASEARHARRAAEYRADADRRNAVNRRQAALPDVLAFAQRILAGEALAGELEAFGRDAVKRATEGLP